MKIDSSELLGVGKELEHEIELIVNKTMTDLYEGLREATPVDTGRARDGWELKLGDEPEIVNEVPYIGVLNDGHSDQAPAGFVEAEIDKALRGK